MSGKSKTLIVIGIVLAAALVFCGVCLVGVLVVDTLINRPPSNTGGGSEATLSPANHPAGYTPDTQAVTINPQATQMVEMRVGYCVALAPADWSFTSIEPYQVAELFSPDKRIYAGWGITSIIKALYPTEESALKYLLGMVYQGFTLTSPKLDAGYGFWSREFGTGDGKKGQLFYKIYDFDPGFFVISIYMAATDESLWEDHGAQALSAAISIRCVTQLRPVTAGVDPGSANPSDPSANPEVDLSENWSEAILGYENVYSPTIGDHYLVPLESYWATGPEGGGYYRELPGGGYELLEDGFGDY